jgi:pseudouridine-5'-phosphate glycosidase
VTPFVLGRLHAESGGRTLRANRDLCVGNARRAGEGAAARSQPAAGRSQRPSSWTSAPSA